MAWMALGSVRLGVVALGSLLAAAAPSWADDQGLVEWKRQRDTVEKIARDSRPIDAHRMSDFLEIRVDNHLLALRTPLANTSASNNDSVRARLDGRTGIVLAHVHRAPQRRAGMVEPEQFSLSLSEFPRPGQSASISVQTAQPGQFTMVRQLQFPDGRSQTIMVIQQRGLQSSGGGLLQLSVVEVRGVGTEAGQLNITATDFLSFVRDHPDETARYVRPLLRELGQEAVFAPEPMVAFQIFSELWKPDSAVVRKVQSVLPRLNARDHHARESAMAELHQMGRDAAAVLLHMDRAKLSAEQNARIDRALGPYAQLPAREALRLRSDPGFLLDCLYSEEPGIRRNALARLRAMVRPDIQFDLNADPQARGAAIAILRQRLVSSAPPLN